MEKSESILNIAKALVEFQSEVGGVSKDGTNPFFKSKYATLDNIISSIRPLLKKNGLSFSQFPTGEHELTTFLLHTTGEYFKSTFKMTPKENTPQGVGSTITYMRRYSIASILGLATEEDDDGNSASGKVEGGQVKKTQSPVSEFEKAKKQIQASKNIAGLMDWIEKKLPESKKYTAAQKKELQAMVNAKVDEESIKKAE